MLAVKTKNNSNKQKKLYPLFFYKDVWDLQDVFLRGIEKIVRQTQSLKV